MKTCMKLHSFISITTVCGGLVIGSACLAGQDDVAKKAQAPIHKSPEPSARVYNISTGQWEEAPPFGPRRNGHRG